MLEAQIIKTWRDYENSNFMNTKALNKYLKLTEWYERRNTNGISN